MVTNTVPSNIPVGTTSSNNNFSSLQATNPTSSSTSSSSVSPILVQTDSSNNNNNNGPLNVDTASSSPGGTIANNRGTSRVGDNRRSNKPIMEKRRRARINNCLNELKTLILDAMKKDPARHSKLEKADILEMTVKHLQNLQRQQQTISNVSDPSAASKFRAGYTECATEVGRFPGLETVVKRKLLQHLAGCLNTSCKTTQSEMPQVQVHILPNPQRSPEQQVVPQSGIILSNGNGAGVQLVPTRLPNGDIALVLPASSSAAQINPSATVIPSPVPLLVPIVPERTGSAISEASNSSFSSSHSPEPDSMYCSTTQQKPLSLVVRKSADNVEENSNNETPWRPW